MTSSDDHRRIGDSASDDNFDDEFAAAFGIPAAAATPAEESTSNVDNADLQDLLNTLSESLLPPDAQSSGDEGISEMIPMELSHPIKVRPAPSRAGRERESSVGFPVSIGKSRSSTRCGTLKLKGSLDAEVELKSTLALRLLVESEPLFYELRVTSDLPVLPTSFSGQCVVGLHEIGSIRFVPKVSGSEELRFELVLMNAMQIPVSRQTGSVLINVSGSRNQAIQAGGDVIIFGGRSSAKSGSSTGISDGDYLWQDVPLLEDASFRIRAENYRPHRIENRPEDLNAVAVTAQKNGLLYCSVERALPVCIGITFGTEASLGRGGDEAVDWWLRPGQGGQNSFAKLSRKHLSIGLKNNHAWICSFGSNGTSLNGAVMTKGRTELLAHGDKVVLAGEMSFSVRLFSDERRVGSIELCREDGVRALSSIVLALPGSPHPLFSADRRFWIAWKETGSLGLKMGSGDWQNAPEGAETSPCDGVKLAWYEFDGAVDQDQVF